MAKSKRKISASQRDKNKIKIAKYLKKVGILSDRVNLHSGAYISKSVLTKVNKLQHFEYLDYKAVKVSKATAQAAKERGFEVVRGNRIIGPSNGEFTRRLKSGKLTGVKPVRGGLMEQVILPYGIDDVPSVIEQLRGGIDSFKLPDEQFAFMLNGNESFRAFPDTQSMIDYLQRYNVSGVSLTSKPEDLTDTFDKLTIFRLHPYDVDQNIRGPRRRRLDRQREKIAAIERGEYVGKPRKKRDKRRNMGGIALARYYAKEAARAVAKREAIKANPAKYEQSKAKAKARAQLSRDKRKGK